MSKHLIAAVQASPVFMDRKARTEKVCDLIGAAAKGGAGIVVLPESVIPGYPDWVWVTPPGVRKPLLDEMYATLLDNAVTVSDDTTAALGKASKAAGVHVAVGVTERNEEASGASLFNTLLFFGPDGELLQRHRKLMPTGAERLVWAQGDGSTLEVYDTPLGKLGGLICWENYMPLARQSLYGRGLQILASPTWDSSDMWLASMQHIARESGAYVVGCCTALRMDEIPERFEFRTLYPEREWINRGNSVICDPRGKIVAGPVAEKEEILYAEVDPAVSKASKWIFDAAGHYARPDVFHLSVNRRHNPILSDAEADDATGPAPWAETD